MVLESLEKATEVAATTIFILVLFTPGESRIDLWFFTSVAPKAALRNWVRVSSPLKQVQAK